jgi:hypothetical protein
LTRWKKSVQAPGTPRCSSHMVLVLCVMLQSRSVMVYCKGKLAIWINMAIVWTTFLFEWVLQTVCAMMPSLNNGCQEQLAWWNYGFCLRRFLESSKYLPWSILFQNRRIIISPLTQLQNHWTWGTLIVGCTPTSHECN